MKKRTIANIVLVLSALFFPWYISLGLALVFAFLFPFYVEAVVLGSLFDALYAPGSHNGFYTGALLSAVSSILPFIISRTPWHSR